VVRPDRDLDQVRQAAAGSGIPRVAARHAVIALVTVCALAPALAAQRLRGQILLPDSATAARGIIVVAADESGKPMGSALTSERGDFELVLPGAGRYVVRALRIGYRPTLVPTVTIAEGETRAIRIVLNGAAVSLAAVTVRGSSVCRIRQDSGQLVAGLWEEARKALTASRLSSSGGRLFSHWEVFDSTTDRSGQVVLAASSSPRAGFSDHPFVSTTPDSLAQFGFVRDDPDGAKTYWGPDADVLLSESFAELHCFRVEPPSKEHPAWVGVSFRPARDRSGISDIEGTLWLDRESAELRLLDYRYTGIPLEYVEANVGGTIEFLRLITGNWLVNRWVIRLPRASMHIDEQSTGLRGPQSVPVRRLVVDAIKSTGGVVTSVERGQELIFSTGQSDASAASPSPGKAAPTFAEMCGGSKLDESQALLHGTVYLTKGVPIAGAVIDVSWRVPGGVVSRAKGVTLRMNSQNSMTSQEGGWWFFCGVPRDADLIVRAEFDGRETEIEVRIPKKRSFAEADLVLPVKKNP
jgi:hypothetical protein